MSDMKHTPEPWIAKRSQKFLYITADAAGRTVVSWQGFDDTHVPFETHVANLERIVSCVNALATIHDPSAVGELVAEVERELEFTVGDLTGFRERLRAILNRMKEGV